MLYDGKRSQVEYLNNLSSLTQFSQVSLFVDGQRYDRDFDYDPERAQMWVSLGPGREWVVVNLDNTLESVLRFSYNLDDTEMFDKNKIVIREIFDAPIEGILLHKTLRSIVDLGVIFQMDITLGTSF
jgi:hypothetical protein